MKTDKSDPSDWLSPILVKELRQGMRGKLFLWSFLLVQLAMIFCASGALVTAAGASREALSFFSGLFWFIIGVPLLLVLPWAGHGTLRNEIKANSLELVYLTRLTPWKIVTGKWAALMAQGLLFVFAILPYLMLRYFLGGIDLLTELTVLAWLLVASAGLTAATVGSSAHNPLIVRGAMFFTVFWGFSGVVPLLFGFSPLRAAGAGGIDQNPYILAAFFVPLVILLMFEIGSAKIGPAAETRSFFIRVIGLVALVGAGILNEAGNGSGIPLFLAAPLVAFICIQGLCETPRWIRSIFLPYSSRGPVGRLAGRFLFYPGWPSAVAYTTLVALAFAFFTSGLTSSHDEWILTLLILFSALIFPVALTRLIRPTTAHGFSWFIATHTSMFFLAIMALILHQANVSAVASLIVFLPTCLGLLLVWDALPFYDFTLYIVATSVMILFSLAILAFRWFPLRPILHTMEQPVAPILPEPTTET